MVAGEFIRRRPQGSFGVLAASKLTPRFNSGLAAASFTVPRSNNVTHGQYSAAHGFPDDDFGSLVANFVIWRAHGFWTTTFSRPKRRTEPGGTPSDAVEGTIDGRMGTITGGRRGQQSRHLLLTLRTRTFVTDAPPRGDRLVPATTRRPRQKRNTTLDVGRTPTRLFDKAYGYIRQYY